MLLEVFDPLSHALQDLKRRVGNRTSGLIEPGDLRQDERTCGELVERGVPFDRRLQVYGLVPKNAEQVVLSLFHSYAQDADPGGPR